MPVLLSLIFVYKTIILELPSKRSTPFILPRQVDKAQKTGINRFSVIFVQICGSETKYRCYHSQK